VTTKKGNDFIPLVVQLFHLDSLMSDGGMGAWWNEELRMTTMHWKPNLIAFSVIVMQQKIR
jgi:hypothetical protein